MKPILLFCLSLSYVYSKIIFSNLIFAFQTFDTPFQIQNQTPPPQITKQNTQIPPVVQNPSQPAALSDKQTCTCIKKSLQVHCTTCDKNGIYCYSSFCDYPPNLDPYYQLQKPIQPVNEGPTVNIDNSLILNNPNLDQNQVQPGLPIAQFALTTAQRGPIVQDSPEPSALDKPKQTCTCIKKSLQVHCTTCDKNGIYCYSSFCDYPPNLDPYYHLQKPSQPVNEGTIVNIDNSLILNNPNLNQNQVSPGSPITQFALTTAQSGPIVQDPPEPSAQDKPKQTCTCIKKSLQVHCTPCDKNGIYCASSFCDYKPNLDPYYHFTVNNNDSGDSNSTVGAKTESNFTIVSQKNLTQTQLNNINQSINNQQNQLIDWLKQISILTNSKKIKTQSQSK